MIWRWLKFNENWIRKSITVYSSKQCFLFENIIVCGEQYVEHFTQYDAAQCPPHLSASFIHHFDYAGRPFLQLELPIRNRPVMLSIITIVTVSGMACEGSQRSKEARLLRASTSRDDKKSTHCSASKTAAYLCLRLRSQRQTTIRVGEINISVSKTTRHQNDDHNDCRDHKNSSNYNRSLNNKNMNTWSE